MPGSADAGAHESREDIVMQSSFTSASDSSQRLPKLPVFPGTTQYLLKSLSDDEIAIPDLAGILEGSPSIASRLVSLANSAWSAPLSPVLSLDLACARLGLSVVRSVSIALAVSTPFSYLRCPPFDPVNYWTSAFLAAEAFELISQVRASAGLPAAAARTVGLLHNIGLLWLTDREPEAVAQSLLRAEREGISLREALCRDHGYDYLALSAALCEAMQLPDDIVAVLREDQVNLPGGLVGCGVGMVSALSHSREWSPPSGCGEVSDATLDSIHDRLAARLEQVRGMAEQLF